jgi:hypothetical protein
MPAFYDLIGEDSAIRITDGGIADGSTPVWATATAIEGICKRWRVNESVETTNTKALGNARKKFRVHSGETRLEIENFVPSTGWSAYSGGTPIGRYKKVEIKELSGMGAYKTWIGVCTEWNAEGAVASEQSENYTVMCDADYATA